MGSGNSPLRNDIPFETSLALTIEEKFSPNRAQKLLKTGQLVDVLNESAHETDMQFFAGHTP